MIEAARLAISEAQTTDNAVIVDKSADRPTRLDTAGSLADARGQPFVDQSRSAGRIGEAIDKRRVPAAADSHGRPDRRGQRELLDSLSGEIGVEITARDAPELLAVRLEEDLEQAATESLDYPALERPLESF